MQVFRDMILHGEPQRLVSLMDEVEKSLPTGWFRDKALEANLRSVPPGMKHFFCFVYDRDDRFPSSSIFIIEEPPGFLRVSNIIPRKKYQLSNEEYNAILEEFCEQIVRPRADGKGVDVQLTKGRADLSDWLSETAAEKLRTFSKNANRRAGYLLPQDHERWLDFILTAHRDAKRRDAPTLRRWLVEIEGWSPEIAEQLAGEYAFGGELLTFSESHRGGG
jgi:hypothetical protein